MEGTLQRSTIFGRFAVGDPKGPDLTSGQAIEIFLGGQWIYGRVEHGSGFYDDNSQSPDGYYFVAQDGGTCGLCTGMQVRGYL